MKIKALLFLGMLLCAFQFSTAQQTLSDFDAFLSYANEKSLTLKKGEIQLTQAKKAKLAAIYGVIDPSGSVSSSYTNNTQLPVTLVPAEVLGGDPGTFEEVQFGLQYQTNFNAYAEIKLLNLQGWENLKLAKINTAITETDNQLALKDLYENSAVIYYNILTLQEQLKATTLNLKAADTLYQSTVRKYDLGLAKQQDVNDSKVNELDVAESVEQIRFLIDQQYIALKLLCDIPETENFEINETMGMMPVTEAILVEDNSLLLENSKLKEKMARSDYRQAKYAFAPTASFFASQLNQQFNTEAQLFDNAVDWIPSNYVGIRVQIPLPSAQAITRSSRAKYDYLLSQTERKQAELQVTLNSKKLATEYEKARSQRDSNEEIYALRKDSYEKYFLNYGQGIGSLEQTLDSFNAMVSSQYGYIASALNTKLALAKIHINNTINSTQ